MKKTITIVLSAITMVILSVFIAACSSSVTGTYKFSSMSMSEGAVNVEIKAGESYMGVTVGEDAYVLTMNGDNTWEMKVNLGEKMTEKGTWEEKDGKYLLKSENDTETITATLDGKTITFEQDGMKLVLKK